MYERLTDIRLHTGERVEAGVVTGPDLDWADRIEVLLAHKGDIWCWQNSEIVRRQVGLEARFYLLHRQGEPLANMMTATRAGVGHFGHVYTRPDDRRQGAAGQLLGLVMDHFHQQGGRALYLGTGFDSHPYRLYAAHGFRGLEAGSGYMSYTVAPEDEFLGQYLAPGAAQVQPLDWPHWPASAPLFMGAFAGVIRCAPLRLFGRGSTEGALLPVLRSEHQRRSDGQAPATVALVLPATGAVAGLAAWVWDPLWPDTTLVDLYCHPDWWHRGEELLAALELPSAGRCLAYSDPDCPNKGQVLLASGFRQTAQARRRLAADRAGTRMTDVFTWER